ncbi:MAG: signal peptidase II [Candidatus Gastranaerophilales bacterium]|nr:signal peptidase II [Candidatus Gastranaerophilales bacterium]
MKRISQLTDYILNFFAKYDKIDVKALKMIGFYIEKTFLFILLGFTAKYYALYCTAHNMFVENERMELTVMQNTGAAFSLFSNAPWLIITFSIFVLLGIFYYIINAYQTKTPSKLSRLKYNALVLLTAGISGNLFERISDGYVTDYIRLKYLNFPIFNAFDIMITIGAIMLIWAIYKEK